MDSTEIEATYGHTDEGPIKKRFAVLGPVNCLASRVITGKVAERGNTQLGELDSNVSLSSFTSVY
jgi:hypothetical protein